MRSDRLVDRLRTAALTVAAIGFLFGLFFIGSVLVPEGQQSFVAWLASFLMATGGAIWMLGEYVERRDERL